ncbi:MAG: PASTA domain-containing protein, partial [Acidimicrobiales bacterium]
MTAPTVHRSVDLPERASAVGAPEIVDPQRTTAQFLVIMGLVLAGLALSIWALTDSLAGSRSIELPRLEVPAVQSLDIHAAQDQLERAGFTVQVQFQPNEEKPKGVVIGQKPLAGSKIEQGELVVVLASDGPLGQSVPDVEGQQANDAVATMQASGLTVEVVPTTSETVRPNEVIGTDPSAGARVPSAGVIRLLVSSGPAPRTVPAVMTKTTEQALADIGRAGLAVGKIKKVFRDDLPPNTVFGVDPPEGSAVPRDTPVSLTVAGPQPTSVVPYLVGLHQASAEKVAKVAGVTVRVVTSPVAAGDPLEGRVIAQGTPPQAEVPENAVVEITVAVVPVPVAAPTTAP